MAKEKTEKSYTYKNIADHTMVLVGVGQFEAGEEFTRSEPINNPNFELIKEDGKEVVKKKPVKKGKEVPQGKQPKDDKAPSVGGEKEGN